MSESLEARLEALEIPIYFAISDEYASVNLVRCDKHAPNDPLDRSEWHSDDTKWVKVADLAALLREHRQQEQPTRCAKCGDVGHVWCGESYAMPAAPERPAPPYVEHGKTCKKAPHGAGGYLHLPEDDGPYDVDGVKYCGRCHVYLGQPKAQVEVERPAPQEQDSIREALRDPIRAALRDLLFTTCESECSPYISQPCGAKFCSYEAMADHLKAHHPDFDPAARPGQADPQPQTDDDSTRGHKGTLSEGQDLPRRSEG